MTLTIQHNPFATQFTRPGAIPFLLQPGEDLGSIMTAFQESQYVGQIVGPHGGGKTTLTHALLPLLQEHFSVIRHVTVRDSRQISSCCRFENEVSQFANLRNSQLLILDGFERLPILQRWLLLNHVRQTRSGLLITTHHSLAGISVLHEVRPNLDTLKRLLNVLAPKVSVPAEIIESAMEASDQNLREALMTLYTWYELKQEKMRLSIS